MTSHYFGWRPVQNVSFSGLLRLQKSLICSALMQKKDSDEQVVCIRHTVRFLLYILIYIFFSPNIYFFFSHFSPLKLPKTWWQIKLKWLRQRKSHKIEENYKGCYCHYSTNDWTEAGKVFTWPVRPVGPLGPSVNTRWEQLWNGILWPCGCSAPVLQTPSPFALHLQSCEHMRPSRSTLKKKTQPPSPSPLAQPPPAPFPRTSASFVDVTLSSLSESLSFGPVFDALPTE